MQIFFENEIGHCFATHAWCPLHVFFGDGKFLLEAGGILRLCKFSLKMRLDITHVWCPLCVFFRAGKCLLEEDGILSLCNSS